MKGDVGGDSLLLVERVGVAGLNEEALQAHEEGIGEDGEHGDDVEEEEEGGDEDRGGATVRAIEEKDGEDLAAAQELSAVDQVGNQGHGDVEEDQDT